MYVADGKGRVGGTSGRSRAGPTHKSSFIVGHSGYGSQTGATAVARRRQPFDNLDRPDEGEVFLDPKAESYTWNFYLNDDLVGACAQRIREYIDISYIVIRLGGKILKPTPAFQRILDMYWKTAASECIDYISVLRVAVVALVQSEHGYIVPKVPGPRTGRISTKYVDHCQYFRWWTPNGSTGFAAPGAGLRPIAHDNENEFGQAGVVPYSQPYLMALTGGGTGEAMHDKRVFIFDNFPFHPTSNGQINSPLKRLLQRSREQSHMMMCTTIADEHNCHPPVLLERVENNSSGPRPGIDYGFFLDRDGEEVNMRNTFKRDAQDVARLFQTCEMYRNYNREGDNCEKESVAPPLPMFPLPMGRKASNVAVNVRPPDRIIERTGQYENRICTAMGVPRSTLMLEGGGSKTRANMESIDNAFRNTLLWYKTKLSEIFTQIYQHIYGDADAEYVVDRLLNAARIAGAQKNLQGVTNAQRNKQRFNIAKAASEFTEKDLYDAKECGTATVTFEIPGLIDFATLEEMWKLRMIDDSEFEMRGRLSSNIPDPTGGCGQDGNSGLGKWSEEDRKALLLGKATAKPGAETSKSTKAKSKEPASKKQKTTSSSSSSSSSTKKKKSSSSESSEKKKSTSK